MTITPPNNNNIIHSLLNHGTSWLKAFMFVSVLLYAIGRGIPYVRDVMRWYMRRSSGHHHHHNNKQSASAPRGSINHSSRKNTHNNNIGKHDQYEQKEEATSFQSDVPSISTPEEYFQLEIPVPYMNLKSIFSDDNLSSQAPIMNQFTSDFLNGIAKRMDFLHKNYVRYLNKLATSGMSNTSSSNQEDLSSSSTTSSITDPSNITELTSLQKRMYPIVFRNKFNLAKDLLLRDLYDSIEKCQLKTEMYRQQVKAISRFIPPSFFLNDPSFAPYYWVLTDIDYKLMPPFLRHYVLYSSSMGASMYGGPFHSGSPLFMGYDDDYQMMTLNSQQQSMRLTDTTGRTNSIPPYIRNRIRYEWELFTRQNKSIVHRYDFLYNAFLSRNGFHVTKKDDEIRYRKEFTEQCYKLLKSRRKVALRKIKTIRLKQIRPSEREKSQLRTQYSKLKQLELLP
ncbi:hypothetical protein C9374_007215 [Naegleria lovaniensis]|uniref:Uncharacterized protein n=1 Tax=Naegleria lovaniensis TaxID=51637 RepID=A0AA88KSH7_NAELO|nr:uncharacterized protein C9374_007215 [Naegleria lovaniensis]KAG2393684.1 hypothetical protein C9374_007215 [Naegleria lovaniensis]